MFLVKTSGPKAKVTPKAHLWNEDADDTWCQLSRNSIGPGRHWQLTKTKLGAEICVNCEVALLEERELKFHVE